MITARSFYKVFGARVVVGGHYVVDDYYEQHALSLGRKPTDVAVVEIYDPEIDSGTLATAKLPGQRRTRTGFAGDVVRSRPSGKAVVSKAMLASLSSAPGQRDARYGGAGLPPFRHYDANSKAKKPGHDLTQTNWVYMYARAVHQANVEIHRWREAHPTPVGINDSVAAQVAVIEADDAEREAEEAALAEAKTEEGVEPPTKRRRARSPTRGIFDHHTSTPHVRLELQHARAKLEKLSPYPALEGAKGSYLATAGMATIVLEQEPAVVDEEGRWQAETPFAVPGTWDFRHVVAL